MFFRLTAVFLGLVLSGAAVEIGLRLWYPESARYALWPPGARRSFRPRGDLMPGVSGDARFTVNSAGLRGREPLAASGAEYRILAVGGSTTECAYLDDSETWCSLVERHLPRTKDGRIPWVGNAGKAGMNCLDHVVLVQRLMSQPPDLSAVIVLVGVNDLTVALSQGKGSVSPAPLADGRPFRIERVFAIVPGRLEDTPGPPGYWPLARTATFQMFRKGIRLARTHLSERQLLQDDEGRLIERYREHRQAATRLIDDLPDLRRPLDDYRSHLETLVDEVTGRGLRLVLMTQPTLWREDLSPRALGLLWKGGVGDFQREAGKPYYTVGALRKAMALYNGVLLQVCRDRGVECIDLAELVGRDESLFYDDEHFTERGARAVAESVAGYLSAQPPFLGSSAGAGDGRELRRQRPGAGP